MKFLLRLMDGLAGFTLALGCAVAHTDEGDPRSVIFWGMAIVLWLASSPLHQDPDKQPPEPPFVPPVL